jgi:cytochrome b561
MTDERYTRVAVALHWLLALALIGQFGLGLWMEEIPKDPPGVRAYWFNLHKSIGLLIVLFVLWRMGWRVAHAVPPLNNTPAWQVKIAKLTHGLMYLLMLLIPVTGFLGSSFSQYPVKFFGMVLPRLWEPQAAYKEVLSEVHEATALLLAGLVVLHLLAVVWHTVVKKDALLNRMRFKSP